MSATRDAAPPAPPETHTPARPGRSATAAVAVLRFYKAFLSPLLPSACRFEPTCSVYAREAIERYGLRRGSGLAISRLFRCHPFRPGGFDPVP